MSYCDYSHQWRVISKSSLEPYRRTDWCERCGTLRYVSQIFGEKESYKYKSPTRDGTK